MFRQPPRVQDISHCRVWPRQIMTDISRGVNWLCVGCLLSAGHCFSAALISGAEPKLMERQECCLTRLAVLLCVLQLTGTHLFGGAAETYYAPAVAGVRQHRCCCLPGWTPVVHFLSHLCTSMTLQRVFKRTGNIFRSERQENKAEGIACHTIKTDLSYIFSKRGLSAKWCKKIYPFQDDLICDGHVTSWSTWSQLHAPAIQFNRSFSIYFIHPSKKNSPVPGVPYSKSDIQNEQPHTVC